MPETSKKISVAQETISEKIARPTATQVEMLFSKIRENEKRIEPNITSNAFDYIRSQSIVCLAIFLVTFFLLYQATKDYVLASVVSALIAIILAWFITSKIAMPLVDFITGTKIESFSQEGNLAKKITLAIELTGNHKLVPVKIASTYIKEEIDSLVDN